MMTPEEMMAAAEAGTLNMDSDESPVLTTEQAPTDTATEASHQDDALAAPISSKSGAYTIPFSELEKARERAKAFASENELLKAQLAQLSAAQAANLAQAQAQAQDRADAGQGATRQDANLAAAQQAVAQGVDPAVFGDFSEEGIARGVETLVDKRVDERVEQRVQQAIAPLLQERQAVAQRAAASEHLNAIYAAHSDADEVAQSAEFAKWRENLPSFARNAIDHVMANGETPEVIEVFNAFKSSFKPALAPAGSKVQQALAQASNKPRVPISLSEMTGQTPGNNPAEQVAALAGNPEAILAHMDSMTPAQFEKLMNSV